ncbi:MAG: LCP family protein [Patescibacteria group bacterium]|mgnify:CR=1 FL=1
MRKKAAIIGLVIVVGLIIIMAQTSRLYPILFQVLFNQDIALKKENSNINILILGTGGGKHEGPDLTDTIIFASIDRTKNRVALVSIPRDLWITDLNAKINTAYSNAEAKRKGEGIMLANAVVRKVVNRTIDYTVRIDFDGFIETIDILGGVDIKAQSAFDDYKYPITGKENDPCGYSDDDIKAFIATSSSEIDIQEKFFCRYKHLHFDPGLIHMDGETALEFVRSRHAQGSDGTDFSRSKRQEQMIKAVMDKVFSINFFLNPAKVISVYNTLQGNIDTNIKEEEIDDFIKLINKMKKAKIKSVVLDYGEREKKRPGLLANPPISAYQNQWVLIPRIGQNDFSEIHKYIDCEIRVGNCPISEDFIAK